MHKTIQEKILFPQSFKFILLCSWFMFQIWRSQWRKVVDPTISTLTGSSWSLCPFSSSSSTSSTGLDMGLSSSGLWRKDEIVILRIFQVSFEGISTCSCFKSETKIFSLKNDNICEGWMNSDAEECFIWWSSLWTLFVSDNNNNILNTQYCSVMYLCSNRNSDS